MDERLNEQVPLSDLAAYRKRKEKKQALSAFPEGWTPYAVVGALAAGVLLGFLSGSGMGRNRG